MNALSKLADLSLAKRALLALPASTRQISCQSGSLWITRDHDLRDIILASGESLATDGQRRLIAYALDAATFSVHGERPVTALARRPPQGAAARGLMLE